MRALKELRSRLARLGKDRRGAAAIEFAFVAPVLLIMYLMTMEISQAIDVNKKVGRAASLTADLVTQEQDIIKSEIDAIMTLGQSVLRPYERTSPTIEIDAITIDATSKATIAWSRKYVGGTASANLAKNTVVTNLPEKLKVPSTFLVRAKTKLSYIPMVGWFAYGGPAEITESTTTISMGEIYYLRPRVSPSIACADC